MKYTVRRRVRVPVENEFLSVVPFVPNGLADSNTVIPDRFGHSWLACQCSRMPSAASQSSRLLRRQMLRTIELKLSPQPSFTAPLVRPRLGLPKDWLMPNRKAGRTSGRVFGRLRSSPSSKLLRNCRGTRLPDFRFIAEGRSEHFQASQMSSQRLPRFIFESQHPVGTNTVTTKILVFLFFNPISIGIGHGQQFN
jgi:hypothetical protein